MIRTCIGLAALGLLAACAPKEPPPAPAASVAAVPAAAATTPIAEESPSMPQPAIVGGFAPADSSDPGVRAALAVATDALYAKFPQRALVEKSSAEVQVVAGLNYRFDLQMSGGKRYTAVVYKPLKGDMVATSVEEAKPPG